MVAVSQDGGRISTGTRNVRAVQNDQSERDATRQETLDMGTTAVHKCATWHTRRTASRSGVRVYSKLSRLSGPAADKFQLPSEGARYKGGLTPT